MEITDIRVRRLSDEGKLKAVVSVTFDHSFVVHDIKVILGEGGLFIAMPSRRTPEGDYRDVAHPIKRHLRTELQEKIIKVYLEAVERRNEEFEEGMIY